MARDSSLRIAVEREDPNGADATSLVRQLCEELNARYGSTPSPFSPEEVLASRTAFVVARLDGKPVGCGALRRIDGHVAEIKRMYVAPEGRRKGIARLILGKLDNLAREFNYRAIRLETGVKQPEAIGLYQTAGYKPIAPYGAYTGNPVSVCFEKLL